MPFEIGGYGTYLGLKIPYWVWVKKHTHKKKITPEVEIIGVKDPDLFHWTRTALLDDDTSKNLAETVFDTSTRPDEARIYLTNGTGASQILINCWIRGKLVKKVGGDSGFLNDRHIDYEGMAKDGEVLFELGNDFIVTLEQVNKLADYHWKYNKTKKHLYTVTLSGFQSFFEPGEWYQLTIGGAGQAEYIDSVVECYAVRCSYNATGSFGTEVSFREVEENWKFDSNETARYIAAGGHSRVPQGNVITVAASNYPGYADYYCDGTSDDASVINEALENAGGATVRLTRGNYNIMEVIESTNSNINIIGDGAGTVLRKYSTDYLIHVHGTVLGTTISNVSISDITFTASTSDTEDVALVRIDIAKDVTFSNNIVSNSPYMLMDTYAVSQCNVSHNTFDGNGRTPFGLYMRATNTRVLGNELHDFMGNAIDGGAWAMWAGDDNNVITSNHIYDVSADSTSLSQYGILLTGDHCTISSNHIEAIGSTHSSVNIAGIKVNGSFDEIATNKVMDNALYGILIQAGNSNTLVANNYCINNGGDTGIGTTASNNFLDSGTSSLITGNSWQL